MIGAVAIALLLAGGQSAIQLIVIIVGFPFLLVMVGVCSSLLKQLRQEPVVSTVPPGVRTVVVETLHSTPVDQAPTNTHSVDTRSRTAEPSKADQPT
jgi:choline-glycine betaine transporter